MKAPPGDRSAARSVDFERFLPLPEDDDEREGLSPPAAAVDEDLSSETVRVGRGFDETSPSAGWAGEMCSPDGTDGLFGAPCAGVEPEPAAGAAGLEDLDVNAANDAPIDERRRAGRGFAETGCSTSAAAVGVRDLGEVERESVGEGATGVGGCEVREGDDVRESERWGSESVLVLSATMAGATRGDARRVR